MKLSKKLNVQGYNTSRRRLKVILAILLGLGLAYFIFWGVDSGTFIKYLKDDINDNLEEEQKIEEVKEARFDEIRFDSIQIAKKDSIILVLSQRKKKLETQLKTLRYENEMLKNNYLNRSLNERILLFSRLATEKDSI